MIYWIVLLFLAQYIQIDERLEYISTNYTNVYELKSYFHYLINLKNSLLMRLDYYITFRKRTVVVFHTRFHRQYESTVKMHIEQSFSLFLFEQRIHNVVRVCQQDHWERWMYDMLLKMLLDRENLHKQKTKTFYYNIKIVNE